MNNRSGYYKNNSIGAEPYKSFVPSPLPPKPDIEIGAKMSDFLAKATSNLVCWKIFLKKFQIINYSLPLMSVKKHCFHLKLFVRH